MVSGLTKLPLKLILLGQILFCGSRLKLKYIGVYSYNGMLPLVMWMNAKNSCFQNENITMSNANDIQKNRYQTASS